MSSSTSSEVVAFVRRTQVSLSELQEAYKDLFDCAQISEDTGGDLGTLRVNTASSKIILAAQSLLDQIHDLRLNIMLQEPTSEKK